MKINMIKLKEVNAFAPEIVWSDGRKFQPYWNSLHGCVLWREIKPEAASESAPTGTVEVEQIAEMLGIRRRK